METFSSLLDRCVGISEVSGAVLGGGCWADCRGFLKDMQFNEYSMSKSSQQTVMGADTP